MVTGGTYGVGYSYPEAEYVKNTYAGLYYQEQESAHYLQMVSGVLTPSGPDNHWKSIFYRPYQSRMPMQWCSVRRGGGGRFPDTLAARSWHWTKSNKRGRPTLFVDGHVQGLINPLYAGDYAWMTNGNDSVGSPHRPTGKTNGDKFAIGE